MRVVVTGATGNLGTSCVATLSESSVVREIIGLARRTHEVPPGELGRTRLVSADVTSSDLRSLFRGADAVVHLAWALQPSHDESALYRTNVRGSERVFEAAAEAGVSTVIYASSIGAYSPRTHDAPVEEDHPTSGISGSTYSAHKVAVERILDRVVLDSPNMRVVRLRPALVFKRGVGTEIHRLFLGGLVPRRLLTPGRIPFVPDDLRLQCVHSLDVGQAIARALTADVRGPFNLAADPVLEPHALARLLRSRSTPIPKRLIRGSLSLAWHLHLAPSEPGWIDLAYGVPTISNRRAKAELGWAPRHGSAETLLELLDGIAEGAAMATPPLQATG